MMHVFKCRVGSGLGTTLRGEVRSSRSYEGRVVWSHIREASTTSSPSSSNPGGVSKPKTKRDEEEASKKAAKTTGAGPEKESYQFLPKSSLPTYYFQKSLPRLPIPKLELTASRYIEALKPLVSPEQVAVTEKLTKEFQEGIGLDLHNNLVAQDKVLKQTSYISAPWFEMYLKDRSPLPINTNPALVFVEDDTIMIKLPKVKWQLARTTNILVSSLRFMKTLDTETLEPEVYHMNPGKSDTPAYRRVMKWIPTSFATYGSYLYKAFPLDMSQFPSLFRTSRIPHKGSDTLFRSDKNVRHITVMRRGHLYSLDVLDASGNILPPDEIMGGLDLILKDNVAPSQTPMGLMTTENRDKWAETREHMISQSAKNLKSLQEIDSSLFVLSLDDEEAGLDDPVRVTRQYLHSDGTNRWFDKSFNLITTKDGWAGLTFEHAWGDGVAVMRFFNDVNKDSKIYQWSTDLSPKSPNSKPRRLSFDIDARTEEAVNAARKRLTDHIESLDIHPFILEKYGKKACKAWGISPDSLMQLGFQVTYHRMYNDTVTTYESCSTSAFKHGRTEAIRPATQVTKEVSQIMSQKNWQSHKSQLKELIKKCSEKHGQLTKDAAMGQGFDRHLFALKNLAITQGMQIPDIYLDKSYAMINHNILSTSTLASPAVRIGAFGPVVKDGLGLAYQIWDTGLGCIAATYHGQKDGAAFVQTCQSTFTDIHEIMSS